MNNSHPLNVWTWRGKVGRARYLLTGMILLAVKHNIDRLLATLYGYPWGIFNYWVFEVAGGIANLQPGDAKFYALLLLIALPFIWIGTVMTLRRLRDADWPLPLVALFFIPLVNLIFFGILSAVPSSPSSDKPTRLSARIGRLIPEGEFGSAVFGIVATVFLTGLEIVFTTQGLGNYGWGLFVGIPFFLGLSSTLIYSFHKQRSLGRCLVVAMMAIASVGATLLALAIEGIICLVMAFPLALVLALFGSFIGWVLQKRPSFKPNTLNVASIGFLLLPGLILLEHNLGGPVPLYAVKTSVVVKANPETVWTNVVSFSELPPPTEAMFKAGLAYPLRAEIRGQGVGAVRHCVFSTGPFVEPITVWDEPRLLAFDVTEQPRAMEELSLYNDLQPPHLDNYFLSRKGQFELKALPDGTTLLEGTTWYENRFWPAPYWHMWSDYIIHNIHQRVLSHIKSISENQPQKAHKTQKAQNELLN